MPETAISILLGTCIAVFGLGMVIMGIVVIALIRRGKDEQKKRQQKIMLLCESGMRSERLMINA